MKTLITQQLLERLASLLRKENRNLLLEYGLQPVHFEALHYLSICNRYSDTPMAVTEYLGQTKGTVSQSLKVLEKAELLQKNPDAIDKRVIHLKLTNAGNDLVHQLMPSPIMQEMNNTLAESQITELNQSLTRLLFSIQQKNSFKSFGQCASCQHNIKTGKTGFLCGLTKEMLSHQDIELICKEHEPHTS